MFGITQKTFFACSAAEATCRLRAGAGAKTARTAVLFEVYSTNDYWGPVFCRSHT